MAEQVAIEHIADHVGQEVTIKGWLYAKTGKGKLQFLQVRDGTGILQCVVFRKEVPLEVFEAAREVTQESSLIVTGTVRADDRAPGVPGGFELGITDLQIVQLVTEGVSHRAQGARRRFPDAEPAPVAALAPVGHPAGAGDHHQGRARLAGRQRLYPHGHAHPTPRPARARRPCSRPTITAHRPT